MSIFRKMSTLNRNTRQTTINVLEHTVISLISLHAPEDDVTFKKLIVLFAIQHFQIYRELQSAGPSSGVSGEFCTPWLVSSFGWHRSHIEFASTERCPLTPSIFLSQPNSMYERRWTSVFSSYTGNPCHRCAPVSKGYPIKIPAIPFVPHPINSVSEVSS